jgi:hypothetical protein
MRGFLAVFANFSVFAEAASQAYLVALQSSISKQYFLCFINFTEDPELHTDGQPKCLGAVVRIILA